MAVFGWDASDFDWARGPMDLAAARADGLTWFTHKATEGTNVRHSHLGEALTRARDAGVEFIGAYHVVRTGNVPGQVAYFLAYLDRAVPWWRTFPGFFLQIDLELWPYDKVSAATGKAFAAALAAAQPKRVITYASRGQYGDQLSGIVTPLWNAAYGSNPVGRWRPLYPGDGSSNWRPYSGQTPVMWQYGSRLLIGTQPGSDGNAFRGTVEQLRALIVGTPTPAPEEDDDMAQRPHFRVKENGGYYRWDQVQLIHLRSEAAVDLSLATFGNASRDTIVAVGALAELRNAFGWIPDVDPAAPAAGLTPHSHTVPASTTGPATPEAA